MGINNLVYSDVGIKLTEKSEGLRLVAYQDGGGVWTIGYGHTAGVYEGMTCTQDQAEQWLREDIRFAQDAVNRLVEIELTQGEFDALVDFVFNLGSGNFAGSTLLKLLNSGDKVNASLQFPNWDRCAGQISQGLETRRVDEEELFDSGEVKND